MGRDERQRDVMRWMLSVFGEEIAGNPRERALRFLEEAVELVQACGLARRDVNRIADRAFSRPVGEVRQELGGVGVTLLALAEVAGLLAEDAERDELARVVACDPEKFRRKQTEKTAAGTAVPRKSDVELHGADPNCNHDIEVLWSGIKCRKCPGWFCS